MLHQNSPKKFDYNWILFSTLLLLFSWGCVKRTNINDYRSVGYSKSLLRLNDLGPDYTVLQNTRYDFFNPQHSIRQKTRQPVFMIRYQSFRLNQYDSFTQDTTTLYGQYLFCRAVSSQVNQLIKNQISAHLNTMTQTELNTLIQVKREHPQWTPDKELAQSFKVVLRCLRDSEHFVSRSIALKKEHDLMLIRARARLTNEPGRSLLQPKLEEQSTDNQKHLSTVHENTPILVKELSKLHHFGTILTPLYLDQLDR